MVKAYSQDLRIKVINYINEGNSKFEACKIFKIGRYNIYRWIRQQKLTGNLKQKEVTRQARKVHYQKLQEIIEKYPDKTLKELGKIFNMSASGIGYALEKLNITFKKKTNLYKERDGQKRVEFLKNIENIPIERIVYIDESAINEFLYRTSC